MDGKRSYTEGPWEFDPETGRIDAVEHRKPTGFITKEGKPYIGGLIALPYPCQEGTVEGNGYLMAAAPDLLDVAKMLVDTADTCPFMTIGHFVEHVVAVREHLARATGESA